MYIYMMCLNFFMPCIHVHMYGRIHIYTSILICINMNMYISLSLRLVLSFLAIIYIHIYIYICTRMYCIRCDIQNMHLQGMCKIVYAEACVQSLDSL